MNQKCVGLFGWIFGHRFTKNVGNYQYSINYCGRCGMPAGGWNEAKAEER